MEKPAQRYVALVHGTPVQDRFAVNARLGPHPTMPGMIRVVQSAGRLLRTGADRGVIALYDRRFLREPYRSLLPDEWLAGRAPEELRGDPAAVARRFFS